MTPEQFAAECATPWIPTWMLAGMLVGGFWAVLSAVSFVRALFNATWTGDQRRAVMWVTGVIFAISSSGVLIISRTKFDRARVIYNRDFAEQDYRAFLERMKYEPKGESK